MGSWECLLLIRQVSSNTEHFKIMTYDSLDHTPPSIIQAPGPLGMADWCRGSWHTTACFKGRSTTYTVVVDSDTPVPVLKEDPLYIQWWLIHQCLKVYYIYSSSTYTSACFKDKSATYTVVAATLVPVLKEDLQKHNSLRITPALLNKQDKSKRGRRQQYFFSIGGRPPRHHHSITSCCPQLGWWACHTALSSPCFLCSAREKGEMGNPLKWTSFFKFF